MPHDNGADERPSERRHRLKSEKDPNRPSRSSRPKTKLVDPVTGETIRTPHRRRKDKEEESGPSKTMADVVPELSRTSSAPGSTSRHSLPYPSFSKAHSREAVNSFEDLGTRPNQTNAYTPDATDVGLADKPRAKSASGFETSKGQAQRDGRPPSPPETEFSEQRKATPTRSARVREEEMRPASQTSQRSWFGRVKEKDDKPRLSTKSKISKSSTTSLHSKTKERSASLEDRDSLASGGVSESALDSNATSVAPKQDRSTGTGSSGQPPPLDTDSSPESAQESSPETPTGTPKFSPQDTFPPHNLKPTPSPFVSFDIPENQQSLPFDSPKPPPPPPPPMVPLNIPRVDYLMQNGGLPRSVPKQLVAVTPSHSSNSQASNRTSAPPPAEIEKVFGPFYNLLDQYETVIAKNGSVAVATGYRSVARRLLDRLENVFNRELSVQGCLCVMCLQKDSYEQEPQRGLGWGDVLEWVSGRRDIPIWPAFDFSTMGIRKDDFSGLGISGHQRSNSDGRPRSPIKMDPDIDEEFREHYLRQSQKMRATVDRWLSSTPATTAAPPSEIDDETLNFTILTHLDQEERQIYNALMAGSPRPLPSTSRTTTPSGRPRSDFIMKTGQALQRLYRLPTLPRDPEACIYLLKNPAIHNLLTTLAEINMSEWEILTSGRFDGFLWSGAESDFAGSTSNSPAISRGPTPASGIPSRGPTPASARKSSFSRIGSPMSPGAREQTFSPPILGGPSRGTTPFSQVGSSSVGSTSVHGRAPVSNDEETEIAALAEVEREIYIGMEALEDAFEALHRKAELVRRALRERGAGLSMAAQNRRASQPGAAGTAIFTRVDTPARGWNGQATEESEVDVESEWGGDDVHSEIAPDDSASNISSSRVRRPKRRNERRTPAPVEEEDEN